MRAGTRTILSFLPRLIVTLLYILDFTKIDSNISISIDTKYDILPLICASNCVILQSFLSPLVIFIINNKKIFCLLLDKELHSYF